MNRWFSHCVPREGPRLDANRVNQEEEALQRQVMQSLQARIPGRESAREDVDVIAGWASIPTGGWIGVSHVNWTSLGTNFLGI